jgi:hypothetical protein
MSLEQRRENTAKMLRKHSKNTQKHCEKTTKQSFGVNRRAICPDFPAISPVQQRARHLHLSSHQRPER